MCGANQSAEYPKRQVERSQSDPQGRQAARDFFAAYLDRRWNKRADERELRRTLKEIGRLRNIHSGLWEEVVKEKAEGTIWPIAGKLREVRS